MTPSNPLSLAEVALPRKSSSHASVGMRTATHEGCIETSIQHALESANYPPLRTLHVRESGGAIVISGNVPSYFMKQMAQAVAMAVAFDRPLRNELRVDNAP
jgi:osmotically-inducible protein OsmY